MYHTEVLVSPLFFFFQEYEIERLESYFQLKNKILNATVISAGTEIGVKRKIQELES
jgi:hypothetical protein